MDIIKTLNQLTIEDTIDSNNIPNRDEILNILRASFVLLFPEYFTFENLTQEECVPYIEEHLAKQVHSSFHFCNHEMNEPIAYYVQQYFAALPTIKELALTDIEAIYLGDPAAINKAEVIITYPGFYATLIYRLAHVLYNLHIPYISRVFTEYAHSKTGIDIHPGATIGSHFCIDHGTGVVIGETATLGDYVKLYQGVTIGARSFKLDEDGNPIKGGKRHPDIGNHVIIYANATILGGDTVIGDGSIIGGNVWLTHSVPENTSLYYNQED